ARREGETLQRRGREALRIEGEKDGEGEPRGLGLLRRHQHGEQGGVRAALYVVEDEERVALARQTDQTARQGIEVAARWLRCFELDENPADGVEDPAAVAADRAADLPAAGRGPPGGLAQEPALAAARAAGDGQDPPFFAEARAGQQLLKID